MVEYKFRLEPFPENWPLNAKIWEDIFIACQSNNSMISPFYHPLFINAAQFLPGSEQPTHLIFGLLKSKPVFSLPVCLRSIFLGSSILEIWGGPGFDYLASLDTTINSKATEAFFEYGLKHLKAAMLLGEHVANEFADKVNASSNTWIQSTFRCPYLLLPNDKQALESNLGSNFRKNIRQNLRKTKEQNIKLIVRTGSEDPDNLTQGLENLFFLHRQRSKDIGRESKFVNESTKNFYQEICSQNHNWPSVVHFFELVDGDRVVASLFGYLIGDRFLFFQSGFSPEYGEYSPGTLTIYHAMCHLIQLGVKEFDFLRGADDYKVHWTSTYRENKLITIGNRSIGKILMNGFRVRRAMNRYGRLTGLRRWLANED